MADDPALTPLVEVDTGQSLRLAARAFAQALTETPEYKAYEERAARFARDQAAQQVVAEFRAKQQSLQMLLRLNAVPAEERAELERLQDALLSQPTVAAYLKAQEDFMVLCQRSADLLSRRIGLSFTAACGPGCC